MWLQFYWTVLSTHFISLKCTRPETVGYDLTTFIRILSCSDLLNAASVYWHIWDAVDWLLSKPRTLKKRLIKGRNELARMKSLLLSWHSVHISCYLRIPICCLQKYLRRVQWLARTALSQVVSRDSWAAIIMVERRTSAFWLLSHGKAT
jgi:hypothetical protein